ncbi:MAG: SDR family oxidoreductase, partial [Pseudomonadota bacterium]
GLEATDDAVRAAGGSDAVIAPADLADPLAVASLVAAVYERFRRLDFVVSAAAFTSPLTPIAHQRPEDWVTSIAVNLTAPFQLMRNAEPLLRQSGGAALFITCKEGQVPRPYYGAYAAAKAGMESLVSIYRAENATAGVRIALFDPGPMATKLRAGLYPGEDPANLPHPDARAGDAVAALLGDAAA